jgi:hypothetical protein
LEEGIKEENYDSSEMEDESSECFDEENESLEGSNEDIEEEEKVNPGDLGKQQIQVGQKTMTHSITQQILLR